MIKNAKLWSLFIVYNLFTFGIIPMTEHPFIKYRSSSTSLPTENEESIGILQHHEDASSSSNKKLISIQPFGKEIPLNTKLIKNWPKETKALCLHCSEKIASTPLPAVKYYDPQDDKFWVYGFFCRPCCSLAYVNEHPSTDNSRCLSWTQQILKKYFGYSSHIMKPAPPRSALSKFGGPMELDQFYGTDGTVVISCNSPPFVTFSMYLEVTNIKSEESTKGKDVFGLRRPTDNSSRVIATNESTDKPPEILNFLAKMGISEEISLHADSTTTSDQIQELHVVEDSTKFKRRKQYQSNEESNLHVSDDNKKQKKKKISFEDDNISNSKKEGTEDRGTLTKYLVKN